mmetsp:Transcript_6995/g.12862  ORF Transcript_6995/g.12862 Transcript_6995/m.12862 type:complete len:567 (-) Transcript_6995:1249-2949(-)
MPLPVLDFTIYTILGSITIMTCGVIALTYFASKSLQVHPAGLLTSLAMCEVALAFHTISWAFDSKRFVDLLKIDVALTFYTQQSKEASADLLCGMNEIILTSTLIGVMCYNTALCLDLLISLWKPIISASRRMMAYHALTGVTVVWFTVYLDFFDDYYSRCSSGEHNRINIINTGPITILLTVYLCVAVLSVIYATIRLKSIKAYNEQKRRWLCRHIAYVTAFIFLWVWAMISYFVTDATDETEFALDHICEITIASSGFVLSLIRTSEPAFWREFFHYIKTCENNKEQIDPWNLPISALIQNEQKEELFHMILSGLASAFSSPLPEFDAERPFKYEEVRNLEVKDNYRSSTDSLSSFEPMAAATLREYAPCVFLDIRLCSNISNEELCDSFTPKKNSKAIRQAGEGEGKSGSFMLKTHDKRFILKTISYKEVQHLRKVILKPYHKHLRSYSETLLARIYGVFTLSAPGLSNIHMIVMQNILLAPSYDFLYDLKGSTVARRANPGSKVMKDLDFLDNFEGKSIEIEHELRESLTDQLSKDTNLLRKLRVMDYSRFSGKALIATGCM